MSDQNTYNNYMILLKQLIKLFKDDSGDTKEADIVRDDMELLWKEMSKVEKRIADEYANKEMKNIK